MYEGLRLANLNRAAANAANANSSNNGNNSNGNGGGVHQIVAFDSLVDSENTTEGGLCPVSSALSALSRLLPTTNPTQPLTTH